MSNDFRIFALKKEIHHRDSEKKTLNDELKYSAFSIQHSAFLHVCGGEFL
jgi:hypothetical protein